jgi:hypothetical protein
VTKFLLNSRALPLEFRIICYVVCRVLPLPAGSGEPTTTTQLKKYENNLVLFAQIWLKKSTTPANLGRTLSIALKLIKIYYREAKSDRVAAKSTQD